MELLYKPDGQPTKTALGCTGRIVVTAAQVTATFAEADLSDSVAQVDGVIFTVLRAGVSLAGGTYTLQSGAIGTLNKVRFATGGGYTLTAGDIITYLAFGSIAR